MWMIRWTTGRVDLSVLTVVATAMAATSVLSCAAAGKAMQPAAAMAPDAARAPMADAAGGDDAEAVQQRPPRAVAMVAREPRRAGTPAGREGRTDGEWALTREFPMPNYADDTGEGPRNDFRETVYWAPSVQTNHQGKAVVSFFLSDAITSFRATAEGFSAGGLPGHGEALLSSKLPVSLAAKLPLEVSHGDVLHLPVTLTNTTKRWRRARIDAKIGAAFELVRGKTRRDVRVAAGKSHTEFYVIRVVGRGQRAGDGMLSLSAQSGGLSDRLERVVKVSPGGYPEEKSLAGTLTTSAEHELTLPDTVPETLTASLRFYPSPVATMVEGTEALIREPTGCFEQASSANYPNVMVMRYLAENNSLDSALVSRTQKTLDRGYKRLTGYESKSKGFEWFGQNPGHEALTAYGLMQFSQMKSVYPDLDTEMVARTQKWLKSRRDGKGGYERNSRALDTFGRASQEVTDAYITYALARTGDTGLDKELDKSRAAAKSSRDPYLLALSAGGLLFADSGDSDGEAALERLAELQQKDGRYSGARESITQSGGVALEIETTALASLAMMASPNRATTWAPPIRRGIDWIVKQRSGGRFGSTQSTILALEALTEFSKTLGKSVPGGSVVVTINGTEVGSVALEGGGGEGIALHGLARYLEPGKNTITLVARTAKGKQLSLPYELTATYRVARGISSDESPVTLSTRVNRRRPRMGQPVRLRAEIRNRKAHGIPMVIARIGIPGGLSYQTWQLDELRDKGAIDFYETREREVIVYFRSMAPNQKKVVNIELLAAVPGHYESPASTTYLYYTDEFRQFAEPTRVTVRRPWRPRPRQAKKAGKPAAKKPTTTRKN